MNRNSTFKDIIHVTCSNIISLSSSILNGFMVPVLLGQLNYGFFKIFALYASYESLGHLGFNDGMMLSFAGKSYEDLDYHDCRSNIIFFTIFQLIFSSCIILASLFTDNSFYKILFILLGVNNFFVNIECYYQKISQSVLRFDEFSLVSIIQNSLLIVAVIFIWVFCKFNGLHSFNFIIYTIIVICISAIVDLWYIYDYRSITFGKHTPIVKRLKYFKKYFTSGAFITFGWGISLLMFNLDSQFVVRFFSIRTYSIYAFAYSIFSAGLVILQSASPVLLPHLKTHSSKYILRRFSNNLACIIITVYLCIAGYFPLNWILYHFIFKYYTSLIYFRLLLPGMVITCCMNMIISSYYYAFKKMKFYFCLSLVALIIAFILDSIVYLIFKDTTSLALSSTISLLIWFIMSNYFLVKWYHVNWVKNLSYLVLMMILFLSISNLSNWIIGLVIYIIVYLVVSLLFFKNLIIKLSNRLFKYAFNLI